jgi:hypothetical protein
MVDSSKLSKKDKEKILKLFNKKMKENEIIEFMDPDSDEKEDVTIHLAFLKN